MTSTDTLKTISGAIDALRKYVPRKEALERAFADSLTPTAFSLDDRAIARYRDAASAVEFARAIEKPLRQFLEECRLAGCKQGALLENAVHTQHRLIDEALVASLKSRVPQELGPIDDFSASPVVAAEKSVRMDLYSGTHIGFPLPQDADFAAWLEKLNAIAERLDNLERERARCAVVLEKYRTAEKDAA